MRLIPRCLLLSLLVSPLACEVGEAGDVPEVSVLGKAELAATVLKNLQLCSRSPPAGSSASARAAPARRGPRPPTTRW